MLLTVWVRPAWLIESHFFFKSVSKKERVGEWRGLYEGAREDVEGGWGVGFVKRVRKRVNRAVEGEEKWWMEVHKRQPAGVVQRRRRISNAACPG